jgi:hypothetical protein
MKRIALILAGLLLAAGFASAQFRNRWGSGQCAPVGAPVQYEWRTTAGDEDHLYLYTNGVQVGGWSYKHRVYMPFDARSQTWSAPKDCAPVGVPERANKDDGDGRGAIPMEMPKKPKACACGCKFCSEKCQCDKQSCEGGSRCRCQEPSFEQVQLMPREMAPGEVIEDGKSNFGLDLKRMHEECPDCHCSDCKCDGGRDGCQCHYSFRDHRGCPLSREKAFNALANGVPDDTDFLRVTWVGPADTAAKLRSDLAGPLSEWGGKICFQTYASADDPMLKDTATGQPLGAVAGLLVQAPSGLPLWYAADYKGAPDLAHGLQVADARRKDPKWDPAKWPALAIEPQPPSPATPPAAKDTIQTCVGFCQNNWGYLATGAGALFLLGRRKKSA